MLNNKLLDIELDDWPPTAFKVIRAAELKIKEVSSGAGQGSDKFKKACQTLEKVVLGHDSDSLYSHIRKPIDVRAYTYLLSVNYDLTKHFVLNKRIINRIKEIKNPMSRLSLMQLVRSYFLHFDEISLQSDFKAVCEFLVGQLTTIRTEQGSDLSIYVKNSELLFKPNGPYEIAKMANAKKTDLDELLRSLSIQVYSDGRFLTICRNDYYIEKLKTIPLGSNDPVLAELSKSRVAISRYTENKMIGHVAVEILIDRSEGKELSQYWQNTILAIAGDPRVPKNSSKYQRWWSIIGEKRISLMRGWLSRFDLKLFLEVLEQSAKEKSDDEIQRMFAPRKKFMEGLLEEGVIYESRLFLSRTAELFLKRHYKDEDLPAYARLDSSRTSMIYLNVKNKVFIIEGSHSFPLKMFNKLSNKSVLNNYSIKRVNDHTLRNMEVFYYENEFGNDHGCISQNHYDLVWQHSAIEFLKKNGIVVAPAKLLPKKSYRAYKAKYW